MSYIIIEMELKYFIFPIEWLKTAGLQAKKDLTILIQDFIFPCSFNEFTL